MNFIVFTPTSVRSAIGRMAALVSKELKAQGCEVTVVRTEAKHLLSTNMHDFGTTVLPWDDEATVLTSINNADACIYHVGNYFEFHEGGVYWLSKFPGIVCLHDFFLGHLFHAWGQTNRVQADSILESWYGTDMAKKYFSFLDRDSFIEGTRETMPMTEWICSMSDGVITHSKWACDRVLNSCSGPVRVVPLAYDAPGLVNGQVVGRPTDDAELNLLTIGHINPNKRVMSVIKSIGLSPALRRRVRYRLIGSIESSMRESLAALAANLGVSLVISGEVEDSELENAVIESDVISCLRWPALEAASASAVEAMLYGKAIIVNNTGFYSDIPESCAIKISHSNEIFDIQSSLTTLLEDRDRLRSLGASAQRWAIKTFTAKNYAEQIKDIVLDQSRSAPARRATNYFCQQLQKWRYEINPNTIKDITSKLDIFEMKKSA
jgi:glycosyltransferase involved in cell wall biosynthesis